MTCLAGDGDIHGASFELAFHGIRYEMSKARAELRKDCFLNCWLSNGTLYLLAISNDGLLSLVDISASTSRGEFLDFHGKHAPDWYPLRDFSSRMIALPFQGRPDQAELVTEGGETLEIDGSDTNYLAEGWIAAKPVDKSVAYLWFPLERYRAGAK